MQREGTAGQPIQRMLGGAAGEGSGQYYYQMTSRDFLPSIAQTGLQSTFERTGEKAPQPGGATASTMEEHIEKMIPRRIENYIKSQVGAGWTLAEIAANVAADLEVAEGHTLQGSEDDHEPLRAEEQANWSAYKAEHPAASSGETAPAKAMNRTEKAAADKAAKEQLKASASSLPEEHFLRRLAESAVRRQRMVEGMITSQYVYGVPEANLTDTITQYLPMISSPVLLRWPMGTGAWEQDQSEHKAMRSKDGVPPEVIEVFAEEGFADREDRTGAENWVSLAEWITRQG
jgi:hypothetical protein